MAETASQPPAGRTPVAARSRRRRRAALALGAFAVLVWAVLAALQLVQARRDTRIGIDRLERARSVLTPTELVRGDGVDVLRGAQDDFRRARGHVRSPLVAPLRLLPVLGRQIRAVDAMTGGAAEVVDIGVEAMTRAGDLLDGALPLGTGRVEAVRDLSRIAERASTRLRKIDLGPASALVGPVDDARGRFDSELSQLREAATHMRDATGGMAGFLAGPRRYLVLAANNSEMRVGSGTFLSAGVLTVSGGELELGDMRPTEEFEVGQGAVRISGDFADRWGWLEPNTEWRNLGSSPRFDTQAELATRMWKSSTGEQVDGVLALDPIALRALLAATGPVDAGGTRIDADNVVAEILLEQYRGLVGYPVDQPRRDRLSAIAGAAVSRLESGEWEMVDLVDELRGAAAGRHVLAWSSHRAEQRGWVGAGISGSLADDELMLGFHNRGGNKLDQFLDVEARVVMKPVASGTDVRIEMEMKNRTPEGLPQYVAGPFPGAEGAAEGLYQGLAVVQLPHLVSDVYMADTTGKRLDLVTSGADGRSWVVAAYVEVPRGGSRTVVVHFRLPEGTSSMMVAPSARVPATTWIFGGDQWRDEAGHRIEWRD